MASYYLIKRVDWDRGENLYLRVPSRGDLNNWDKWEWISRPRSATPFHNHTIPEVFWLNKDGSRFNRIAEIIEANNNFLYPDPLSTNIDDTYRRVLIQLEKWASSLPRLAKPIKEGRPVYVKHKDTVRRITEICKQRVICDGVYVYSWSDIEPIPEFCEQVVTRDHNLWDVLEVTWGFEGPPKILCSFVLDYNNVDSVCFSEPVTRRIYKEGDQMKFDLADIELIF